MSCMVSYLPGDNHIYSGGHVRVLFLHVFPEHPHKLFVVLEENSIQWSCFAHSVGVHNLLWGVLWNITAAFYIYKCRGCRTNFTLRKLLAKPAVLFSEAPVAAVFRLLHYLTLALFFVWCAIIGSGCPAPECMNFCTFARPLSRKLAVLLIFAPAVCNC